MFSVLCLAGVSFASADSIAQTTHVEEFPFGEEGSEEGLNLLQLRANNTVLGSHWWKDQGCRAQLGSDIAKCRLKSDVHVPKRFDGDNIDSHQRGFRLAAETLDGTVTLHAFQCPWGKSPTTSQISGVALQIGDHLIECHRPPDCHQYLWCRIDGEDLTFATLPRMWPDGLYIERGSHKHICIDSPDGRSSVQLYYSMSANGNCEEQRGKAWFEVDMKIQRDNAKIEDDSICGATNSARQAPSVKQLSCEESLFSSAGCTTLCSNCDWGNVPGLSQHCENLPDPETAPPSENLCMQNGCSFEHAKEACGALQNNHAVMYEGCLLDVCSQCESEEEQDVIAAKDIEDEEATDPGPTCVDQGATCGLPSELCVDATKLNTVNVVHNNLAGAGPDTGAEGIRYSAAAVVGGRVIDLLVNAVGGEYKGKPKLNGHKNAEFGRINLKNGASVELQFSFVDAETGEPVTLDSLAMTFFDLDEGIDGAGRTTITACDAKNAILTTNTELALARPNDCYALSSTEHGTGANNPSGLDSLTPDQAGRCVTFDYEKVSSIRVSLDISKGWKQRNVLWAFNPALACLDGNDPEMPLNAESLVDPDAPSQETCPEFGKGDGQSYYSRNNKCAEDNYGGDTLMECYQFCQANCETFNGFSSGAAVGHGATCYCEQEQMGIEDRNNLLNIFCPPWKPNCRLDLWRECKAAVEARGGFGFPIIDE